MYNVGAIVTLMIDKQHKEGDEVIHLKKGVCGMITDHERFNDGNHSYTVNFGPYGGWYCKHNELSGDDPEEGWDSDEGGPYLEINSDYVMNDDNDDLELPRQEYNPNIPIIPNVDNEPPPKKIKIDPEADIARRIKELEGGKK